MATHGAIASQLLHSSFSPVTLSSRIRKLNRPRHSISRISCQLDQTSEDDDNRKRIGLELLKLSATLTIVSTCLPTQVALAAKVASSSKKRASASTKKQQEALTPEQYNSWAGDLPVVKDRLACTDLFDLKQQDKLKHVIKPPHADLGRRAEVVLAVLNDNRVLRTVLPSRDGSPNFWGRWEELGIDSICVNAYTPPLRKAEVPSPYLGFLAAIPRWMISTLKAKAERDRVAQEQKRAKEEKRMKKRMEVERIRQERVMMDRAYEAARKMEEDRIKKEKKEKGREMLRYRLIDFYASVGKLWRSSSNQQNQSIEFGIALFMFVVFYRVVVLSYKKQRKDYDDRVKIQEADAEEKRKMKEMEMEMVGIVEKDRNNDEGKGGGEDDPNMKMVKDFMRSGARIRRTGTKKRPQFLDKDADVKFSDVAGLGEIRVELEEIVKFFKERDVYRRRGVKIPGGILLCGPPGVGKTLLAKAVAGEAGVNFLSISASQFVEIYVGVGASRVRQLYQEAKDLAPAVVFIDELDAVGRERGRITGSGGQERDATLNQLLVCLDGFEGRGDVITIASTNRPDVLDPALVRPGRFDRKIFITKPSSTGRLEILQVHARKKPLAEDVDLEEVARATDGMVGAELANIFEVAALNMLRDGRREITTDDLLQAALMEQSGMLEKQEHDTEMWRRMAINQAAEAVVAVNFPDYKNIEFINIAPRAGGPLGYVRYKMNEKKYENKMLSRLDILDHITIQLAPRAADEMYYGEKQLSTIWAESADDARATARSFVLSCLSEKNHGVFIYWTDKINDIDTEALRILNMCYERVKEILQRNRKLLDEVVGELTEKKSLTKQEFSHLVEVYGVLDPPRPNLFEIRAERWKRFRNTIADPSTIAPSTAPTTAPSTAPITGSNV